MANVTGTIGNDLIDGADGVTNGTDVIDALAGDDRVFGFGGNDVIFGWEDDDELNGGAGADQLYGGSGNDTASYVGSAAGVSVDLTGGTGAGGDAQGDSLFSIENLVGTDFADALFGNSFENHIDGGSGVDFLTGEGGNDTLDGGEGNDTIYGGAGSDELGGGDGDDTLFGLADDDIMKGVGGADSLDGGEGSDFADYTLSQQGVVVSLAAGVGSAGDAAGDTLVNIEHLIGSRFADVLTGNDGANLMLGFNGDDVLNGLGGDDELAEIDGDGNDTLDGGSGADWMQGGYGNDTYRVDNPEDFVSEQGGDGNDLVESSASFSLANLEQADGDIENLRLVGAADIDATGNALANIITGNFGANALAGLAGNDVIFGGDGNDIVDGGPGADDMRGGAGNDLYVVDDAADVANEIGGDGIDTIRSSIDFSLADGQHAKGDIENLTLVGTADIDGTGNDFANRLSGNAGANFLAGLGGDDVIDGGLGADDMRGGAGNDLYVVDDTGDIADEDGGDGIDTIGSAIAFSLADALHAKGAIENLTLTGSADIAGTGNQLANLITGNTGANILEGADGNDKVAGAGGNDIVSGGRGNDVLTGGAGANSFVFALSRTANVDVITDFSAEDTIVLDNAVFAKLKGGVLKGAAFHEGRQAHDASDRVIYNEKTGVLRYDDDGTGLHKAKIVAILDDGTDLRAADFFVI